jgi:uncharacterized protein YejL (UPF0352 family)
MKKQLITLFSLSLIVALVFGCATKNDLDPAGIYKSDAYLYNIDQTIITLYDAADAFVLWEYQNNDYLKTNSPTVFNLANQVRSNMPNILKNIKQGRDLYVRYLGNPNESLANISLAQTQLSSAVSDLQNQVAQAQSAVVSTTLAQSYTNTLNTVTLTVTNLP